MKARYLHLILVIYLALASTLTFAQIATGGTLILEKAVTANGGGEVSGGIYSVTGTAGQPVAGVASIGTGYSAQHGFWVRDLAPTASMASIRGRLTTADGSGIRGVVVTLQRADGTFRTTLAASLGYYFFNDVESGQSYVLSVASKRFAFAEPSRIVNVGDDVVDVDFVAMP